MRLAWWMSVACLVSLGLGGAVAQQAGTGAPADGGTTEQLQSIFIPPKPDAPFVLELETEWVRPMGNGDSVTLTNRRMIARDIHGRIFQERRLLMPPHDGQTPVTWIQIADPDQHTLYNCSPARQVCYLYTWTERAGGPDQPEGSTMYPGATVETKDLGKDIKAGVEVRGTRVTTTIAPGVLGNSRPIVGVREFWFSDALGLNISSLRRDPRFGKQRFEVKDLKQDVPDASLFQVPEGFSVVDDRVGGTK